jgi:hypothetical protein
VRIDATAFSAFARKTAESVSEVAGLVHNLVMDVRDSYRPELHDLRGPGPKWRAKHQPWQASALARIDAEAMAPAGHDQLSPVHFRRRAHRTR